MGSVKIGNTLLNHDYPFDPSYGYDLDKLLRVPLAPEPDDFSDFWKARYERATSIDPKAKLEETGLRSGNWRVYRLSHQSTDELEIKGWALLPIEGHIRRGFVVGHGYGGRDAPDPSLPFENAALFFPCSRGLSLSRYPTLPSDPNRHVVHGIESKENYLIGGCVEDLWLSISSLLQLFPETKDQLHLLGVSFSGGTSMLAAPWDPRISRVHCNVPTFGQQGLRLKLQSVGSAYGVFEYEKKHPGVAAKTLAYYDAATAAKHLQIPCHLACAQFDPAVAPPGQFAIYNALPEKRRHLFPLTAGHFEYPNQAKENADLLRELCEFFA